MCTIRNPIHPKQLHEIRNACSNPVAGEEVIVLWERRGIDFPCAGDLLEFGVDDVELVFADMRRAVGHAEVEPGVVAVGHLLELFADNGFWDDAVSGVILSSGEAFYGEGLEAVAELGAVF
jgi:hypothetical protein